MAQIPKKSVRKLVTLPMELAERVESFRKSSGAPSESDALKILIEHGLRAKDTVEDLFARCKAATANGQSLGDIINFMTSDHPLVFSTVLDSDYLKVYLKTEPNEREERFRYSRSKKEWHWECRDISDYQEDDWKSVNPSGPPKRRDDLDDEIPF